ncbi:MAG: terminase gpA endonuclease subunit, partial [Thermodesulfobacteriota bacterium]
GVLPPELVPGAEVLLSDDLRSLLAVADQTFADSEGREHRVRFGLVDSGYRTDEVYELARVAKKLLPSKGVETESKRVNPLTYTELDTYPGTRKKILGGLKLVSYSPDVWKDALSRRLLVDPGRPGAWHLHAGTGPDYLSHFRAEARDELSGPWELRGRRPNHLFDVAVLQVIAHEMLGRPPYRLWEQLARERGGPSGAPPPAAAAKPASPMAGRRVNPFAR